MLLFEYKRDNQEVIVQDEPTINTEQRSFQVRVTVISQPPPNRQGIRNTPP